MSGPPAFEHVADLPRVHDVNWDGIVIVGHLAGERSTATVHTPLVGAELTLTGGSAHIPLDPGFEHGVIAVSGAIRAGGQPLAHRHLRYLAPGATSVTLETDEPALALLIGGEPFDEPLVMWWNFVGRDHDEIVAARDDWEAGHARFGHVDGHGDRRIPAPPMPPLRLKPRA